MSYLLDTNVLSELRKTRPDPHVSTWLALVQGDELFISVLAIGEIRQGIERVRRRDPAQGTTIENWLNRLRMDYADRILPVSTEIAEEWGRLNVPDPVPVIDGLMAATALVHRLTFVTRNTSDVARTGVNLLNPFDTL